MTDETQVDQEQPDTPEQASPDDGRTYAEQPEPDDADAIEEAEAEEDEPA